MRLAILADIHGNLLALDRVLADLEARGGADALVIAGDLCLAGPQPREALERVRTLDCPVIQGNTDRDLAASSEETAGDEDAALLEWTREQLGTDALDYLRALPFAHSVAAPDGGATVLIVHANPRNLDDPLRPLAPQKNLAPLLNGVAPDVTTIAFGHLHIPYTRRVGRLLLADISSVGLPKDGDRRAGYGLLTWADGAWTVEQRRVEYPVEEVAEQLRTANPPDVEDLVQTLLRARYPNMTKARGGRVRTNRQPSSKAPVSKRAGAERATDRTRPGGASGTPVAPRRARAAGRAAPAREVAAPADVALARPPDLAAEPAGVTPGAGDQGTGDTMADALPANQASLAAEAPLEGRPETATAIAPAEVAPALPVTELPLPLPDGAAATPVEGTEDRVVDTAPVARDERRSPKAARKGAKRAAKRAATPALTPDEPFSLAVRRLLAERLDTLLAQTDAVRAGDDPEAVHDMRVATRRLRAVLDAAEPFSKRKPFRRQYRTVKALADALGAVRDRDVTLEFLRERLGAAPEDERPGLEGLIGALRGQREGQREELLATLERLRDEDFAGDFGRFAGKIPKDWTSVATVAKRMLTANLDRFEARAGAFATPDDVDGLHRLRITAKRLRYTLELFGAPLGSETAGMIEELKGLQDGLGLLHDRDVLAELLVQERRSAARRGLGRLARTVTAPGPRAERLASVHDRLHGPASFSAAAPGIYGLLADVADQRRTVYGELRDRWEALEARGFLQRLRALALPRPDAGATAVVESSPADGAAMVEPAPAAVAE